MDGSSDLFEVTDEMVDAIAAYMAMVTPLPGKKEFETQVALSNLIYGTADLVTSALFDALYVVDFKYGKHVYVSATNNSQLRIYAIGALNKRYPQWRNGMVPFQMAKLGICQPRCGKAVERWDEISLEALARWELDEVLTAVRRVETNDLQFVPGEWCRWCPVGQDTELIGGCRKMTEDIYAGLKVSFSDLSVPSVQLETSDVLSPAQIAKFLELKPLVMDWFAKLEKRGIQLKKAGTEVPGFKLVRTEGHRKWISIAALHHIFPNPSYWEIVAPRTPLSPSALEKLMKQKGWTGFDLSPAITKPQGNLVLAPLNDPRSEELTDMTATIPANFLT